MKIKVNPDEAELLAVVEVMVQVNERYLRRETVPPLYQSRVRCGRAECGPMRDIQAMLRDGVGDSDEIAAWRAAELRSLGISAQIVLEKIEPGGCWRALVQYPNGKLEDPARHLRLEPEEEKS